MARKWYRETTEVYLGRRSLRFFDSDTGYWVICFMLGGRMLCYYWDPARYIFVGRVESVYVCGVKMCGYCNRADRSRNIRVEAISCREVYRWRTGRYRSLRQMYRRIFMTGASRLEDARYIVHHCFQDQPCIGENREGMLVKTRVVKMRRLSYDRCDNIPKECDPDSCSCWRVGRETVGMLWWREGLGLMEAFEAEGEASDCVYFETLKKWVCSEYE
jgi:hypothetical protein